jgi:hypothetical protein
MSSKDLEAERAFGQALLDNYAGMWVAVRGHTVIKSADTPEQLDELLGDEKTSYRSFLVRGAREVALLGFRSGALDPIPGRYLGARPRADR